MSRTLVPALLLAALAVPAAAEENEWTLLEQGIAEVGKGHLERAERILDAALRRNAECRDAYYYLGMIREKQGKLDEAVAFYGKIGPDAPTSSLAAGRLGEIAVRAGRHEEALAHLQAFAEAHPSARAHMRVAAVLLELGRHDETEAALKKAAGFSKDDLELHDLWGRLHMEKKSWHEALERWERILKVIPGDLAARHLKATCLLRMDRRAAAVKEWEGLLSEAPYHDLALRAAIDACASDPERARQVLEWRERLEAIRKNPPRVRHVAGDAAK